MRGNKRTPFLDVYNRNMQTGKCSYRNGLCSELDHLTYDENFNIWVLMIPTAKDMKELAKNDMCTTYWAEDKPLGKDSSGNDFTVLRQTLILLCAVMNNEY